MVIIGIPMFWECSQENEECSREDDYCVEGMNCEDASKNYTVPYCVSSDVDYAEGCVFQSLTNSLSSGLSNFATKDLISQYCTALLWNQENWRVYFSRPNSEGDRDWSQTFDSHQSLFVYLLCSSLSTGDVRWSDDFPKVLKWDVVKLLKLQQRLNWKDKCSVEDGQNLDDCDMSIYATEIFSAIMSDVFKIKYAQIFHVDSVESFQKDKKKRVWAFLSWYFGMDDEKKVIKDFPDTVGVIDSNQQYYKSVLKSLKLLDNSKLAKMAEESWCPSDKVIVWTDFVACALHSSQWNWSSSSPEFLTLFYNEIMNYRIFVTYYYNWIQVKIKDQKLGQEEKDRWQTKAEDIQFIADLQIKAAKETLRSFEELNMTYPLHIWLLLYQEKLREFRNKYLPSIVQQFYSLSEKLQNVQLPE